MNDIIRKLISDEEDQIKAAIISNGFTLNETFLIDNFRFVEIMGDDFKHLFYHYGQSDQKRIISIQRTPSISWSESELNTISCKAEVKYY